MKFRDFHTLVALVVSLVATGLAHAEPQSLSFSGLTGESKSEDVRHRFPQAEKRSVCRDGKSVFESSDGPYKCDYLTLSNYELFGYNFEVLFFFYPSGGLKSANLTWPSSDNQHKVSDRQLSNAYLVVIQQFGAKYGPEVQKPPCHLIGKRCAEWQMNGLAEWQAGGERIEIELETKLKTLRGLNINYQFADRVAFDRF